MKFREIVKGIEAEGKEKHIPVIEVSKGNGKSDINVVKVTVGKEVPHPNTIEHHIAWIELFGVNQDGQVVDIGRAEFAPVFTDPNARFQLPAGDFKAFCALSYCNIHGVWQNCIEF